jgi:hypothetical protein
VLIQTSTKCVKASVTQMEEHLLIKTKSLRISLIYLMQHVSLFIYS